MEEKKDKDKITDEKITFRVCDQCLGVNLKTLIPKLKKKAPNAEFIIGCQSYCGPGRKQTFTLVNSRICIADTEIELMPLVDEKLKENFSKEDEEKYQKRLERRLERTFYFIIPENITIKLNSNFIVDNKDVIARKAGRSYIEKLEISSNVDTTKEGVYEVIYKIELDDKVHTRTRKVIVEK